MNKQSAFLLFALLTLVLLPACGGPGQPTSRVDELRNAQGNGGTNNPPANNGAAGGNSSSPERPSPSGGPPKQEDSAKDDKSADDGMGIDEHAKGEGEEGEGEDGEESEESDESDMVSSPNSNVPAGLKRMGSGGQSGGDKKKKDNKKKEEENKQPPGETEDTTGGLAETAEVVKRRFTFFERANQAFITGNEFEAFQYLFAHVIAEDGAMREHPLGWYPGVTEPRVGLRWGVGVDYRAGNFSGDPPRFDRSSGTDAGAGGGGGSQDDVGLVGGGGPGGRDPTRRNPPPAAATSNKPDGKDPVAQLDYYTSAFGKKLVERLEMRRTNQDFFWGKALHDIDLNNKLKEPDTTRNPGDSSTPPVANSGGGGIVSTDGDLPSSPSAPSQPANNSGEEVDTGFVPEFTADPSSLSPGVMMLGLGKNEELLEMAKAHGLDLVAVFYVSVQTSTKSEDKTTASITILDVKTGEVVAETKRINTTAYAKAVADGGDDPIEDELDKLFPQATDKEYKVAEWPNISGEAAAKRVDKLLQQKYQNPLPVLAEIRHYQEAGLITKDEFLSAAEALIGADNARKLVDGQIADREIALKDWLPGQFKMTAPARDDGNFR